jgi:uncharacterized protein GlcG (DUF336 family)
MDLLAFAKKIADRAEAVATRSKLPISVCVIDTHGNIVLKHRMTGAPAFSSELSERKAYRCAMVRLQTADILPLAQPERAVFPLMRHGRYFGHGGGAPLASQRGVVAGVGLSGGTVEQDVDILEAALGEL